MPVYAVTFLSQLISYEACTGCDTATSCTVWRSVTAVHDGDPPTMLSPIGTPSAVVASRGDTAFARTHCLYPLRPIPCMHFRACMHAQASSRIIGRQGAFIKQLQRESGCKINTLKDTDLRSGLKARVMNVCGTNSAMSKGLYLIARKIASRWEYAPEWEGGDPTLPSGQGLPTSIVPPHAAPPPEPSAADGDSGRDGGRRQRGGRGRGGGRDRGSDLNRYERDSSRTRGGESDRRGGGGGADRSDNNARDGGGGGRYGRGGGGRDDGPSSGGRDGSKSSRSGTAPLQTTSAPWISDQPSGLPSVVGGAPAPGSAAAAAASTEAWQRLLGQIPATARESLGFGALPVPGPAADVFGQFAAGRTTVAAAAPQQLQQPPQVCVVSSCCVLPEPFVGWVVVHRGPVVFVVLCRHQVLQSAARLSCILELWFCHTCTKRLAPVDAKSSKGARKRSPGR